MGKGECAFWKTILRLGKERELPEVFTLDVSWSSPGSSHLWVAAGFNLRIADPLSSPIRNVPMLNQRRDPSPTALRSPLSPRERDRNQNTSPLPGETGDRKAVGEGSLLDFD